MEFIRHVESVFGFSYYATRPERRPFSQWTDTNHFFCLIDLYAHGTAIHKQYLISLPLNTKPDLIQASTKMYELFIAPFGATQDPLGYSNQSTPSAMRAGCSSDRCAEVQFKKLVKQRDKRCVCCLRASNLSVVRIIPPHFKYIDNEMQDDPMNGLLLCIECHTRFRSLDLWFEGKVRPTQRLHISFMPLICRWQPCMIILS